MKTSGTDKRDRFAPGDVISYDGIIILVTSWACDCDSTEMRSDTPYHWHIHPTSFDNSTYLYSSFEETSQIETRSTLIMRAPRRARRANEPR